MVSSQYPYSSSNTDKGDKLPSTGELERAIGQDIQSAYRRLIGSKPNRVMCHFFSNYIGITIEESITLVEELLSSRGNQTLVEQVRQKIDATMRDEIYDIVQNHVGLEASSILLETSLEANVTGALVVLVSLPSIRNPQSLPKADWSRRASHRGNASQS